MIMLVQAIISTAAFHGNEAANIEFEPDVMAGILDIEVDSERFRAIMRLFGSIREKLGDVNQEARALKELLKYETS